jgi:serine/threonine-protein kinase PpkA
VDNRAIVAGGLRVSETVVLKSVQIDIPGYRILRPLGEGGMASVFLALQESLDREVALKVMAPALAANAEFTDRFLKEGRITAKLNHPNLVTVFDIGSHGTVYYLAAEYIPGGTLKERIDRGGLTVAEILDIVCDVARGLDFAHQKGFVHRDVKPGNILFKNDGTAVLADFGIAKAMDASAGATMAGASIGTPDYMSPEQARAEPVDGRSDLYSMGAMLYEMLVGHPPYQASDPFTVALMHVTQPVPELPAEFRWLQPLIDGLMAKVPANRFASGDEFIKAVERLLAAAPQGVGVAEARSPAKRSAGRRTGMDQTAIGRAASGRKNLLPLAAGGVVALLAVGLGLWAWLGGSPEPDVSVPGSGGALSVSTDPDAFLDTPEALLLQAQAYMEQGFKQQGRRLVSPPGENAAELFKDVLKLSPGNAEAEQGLNRIATFYRENAEKLIERNLYQAALLNLEEGLVARPDDERMQALLAKVRTELEP